MKFNLLAVPLALPLISSSPRLLLAQELPSWNPSSTCDALVGLGDRITKAIENGWSVIEMRKDW